MKQSNFDRVMDILGRELDEKQLSTLKKIIKNYIIKNEYRIKFLNYCTQFMGVRTKNQIIICSPSQMQSLGDFVYTIFHEIRHDQQIGNIKMKNPFVDFDLNDFEKLYKQYWEMELDADEFAKNKLKMIVSKYNLDGTKFLLSPYIMNYSTYYSVVRAQIQNLITDIKSIIKSGQKFEDIQDHPIIQQHLGRLEDFI